MGFVNHCACGAFSSLAPIKKACADANPAPTFHLHIELKGDGEPGAEALKTINELLQKVSGGLKIS
ncbi:MAG TPA: hypothetical protein VKR42_12350 [Ktedonobacteraceae bacterium]|nr:hypothetical protein [Ktedonobacteraceae bacterium]